MTKQTWTLNQSYTFILRMMSRLKLLDKYAVIPVSTDNKQIKLACGTQITTTYYIKNIAYFTELNHDFLVRLPGQVEFTKPHIVNCHISIVYVLH